jgi:hypothetical protein
MKETSAFHIAQQLLMKDPDSTGHRKQLTTNKQLGKQVIAILKNQEYRVTAFYGHYSVTIYVYSKGN